jgi:hypothetical protein
MPDVFSSKQMPPASPRQPEPEPRPWRNWIGGSWGLLLFLALWYLAFGGLLAQMWN